VIELIVWS